MLVGEPRNKFGDSLDVAPLPGRLPSGAPLDCSVVVFAAGLSTRFGRNKLLEPVGNTILVRHVVSEALSSRADRVIVVGGFEFEALRLALAGLSCEVVYNEDYTRGQSFSVRKGMSLVSRDADAVLFEPGDMPLAGRLLFDAVILEYARSRAPIVSAGYRGRPGHPILFDNSLFDELREVNEATRGLKRVVSAHRAGARIVETSIGALFDLDTPYDLSLLEERKSDADFSRWPS